MNKVWRVSASIALLMVGCSGSQSDDLDDDGGRPGASIDGGGDTASRGDSGSTGGGDGDVAGDGDAGGGGDGDSGANSDAGPGSNVTARIASFSGPASACDGSQVALSYSFTGRSGDIAPGDLQVAAGSGQASATLHGDTDFVLEAKGVGGPVTAHAMVTALPSPDGTITTSATAAYDDTLSASVPSQSGVTYAWSVVAGDATIQGSSTGNQVSFNVGTTGSTVDLQVQVTSNGNGCATSKRVSLPVHCALPTLISLDRSQPAGTPQYIPTNEGTRAFAINDDGTLWAPYLINNAPGVATYNLGFTRRIGGAWSVPSGSPSVLNEAGNVYDTKVATNNAGDAVFVWTDLSAGVYHTKLRSYRASTNTWSAVKDVGTTVDNGGPVFVALDQDDPTGKAVVVWLGGAFNAVVPHVRSYTLSTDTLGSDIAVRASTTNNYPNYLMTLDFEANANLDGFLAWTERDSGTSFTSVYALHMTGGAPDSPSAGTYAIQTVAAGATGNDPNPWPETIQQKTDMFAMSEAGSAIVVWRRVDASNVNDIKWYLLARRFIAGSWGAVEQISVGAGAVSSVKPAIDDAGNAILATWSNGLNYAFTHALAGQAWAASTQLASATSGAAQIGAVLRSETGKGLVIYRDQSLGIYAPMRGAFYDSSTQTLSPSFTISSPIQGGSEIGRVSLDAEGKATVLFTQMPNPVPAAGNSSNSSLEFATTCE